MVCYVGTRAVLKTTIKDANITLNNGVKMPIVGAGTFRIRGQELIFSVIDNALKAGYRSFDTATVYGNECEIGSALKALLPQHNLKREDIFITSKLAPKDQGKDRARQAVEESLNRLALTYIDLYLIHWPGSASIVVQRPENRTLRQESWEALVALQQEGKLKAIGVSNYTVKHLNDLLANSSVPPAVNQVEFHPYFRHPDALLNICGKHNILLQAYSSFGGTGETGLLTNSTIVKISKELKVRPSQILLRWALQHGFCVIPKSVDAGRLQENIHLDFNIPDKFMNMIDDISLRKKYAWDPEIVT